MKKVLFIAGVIGTIVMLGYLLNPLDARMFTFHDDTQAVRVNQMALSIRQGHFPPRLAPDLSFGLGFPVFNFYAPFSYWPTTLFHLAGIPVPAALKLSFLLSLITAFTAMFLFLRMQFKFASSFLGATAYVTSLWFAVEIFVRGNLAECWFLALFPLALYFLKRNTTDASRLGFLGAAVSLSALLTVHNVLSLIALLPVLAYALILKNRKTNLLALFFAFMLSSYFLVPALLETSHTHAAQVAKLGSYRDHFLCVNQLWSTPNWEYGGSAAGCEKDGMPFTLGKIHIMLGAAGSLLFAAFLAGKKSKKGWHEQVFFLTLGVGSMFLTLYPSSFVWDLAKPLFSLFQFPWRFLVFTVFSLSFFAAYLLDELDTRMPRKAGKAIALCIAFLLFFTSRKFFSIPWLMSYDEYGRAYVEKPYLNQTAAYHMAEYLPRTADYPFWRSLETKNAKEIPVTPGSPVEASVPFRILSNRPFVKEISLDREAELTVNVHYFPYWQIYVNNNKVIPSRFDRLGRPLIRVTQPSIVHILYHETLAEKAGNMVSGLAIVAIAAMLIHKPLWNKTRHYLK
jgi:hypothetical protein